MRMSGSKPAGYALAALFLFLIVFQALLALGVDMPGAAWGSRHETLTPGLRAASLLAILILVFGMCVVFEKVGTVSIFRRPGFVNFTLWFFAAYFLLNTFMNAISPGEIEKYFMTPLALTISVLCMVVAKK